MIVQQIPQISTSVRTLGVTIDCRRAHLFRVFSWSFLGLLLLTGSPSYRADAATGQDSDLANVTVERPATRDDDSKDNTLFISDEEKEKLRVASKSFQSYSSAMSPRLGLGFSVQRPSSLFYSIGVAFQLPHLVNPRDEFALDFTSKRDAYVSFSKKWIRSPTEPFRFMFRWGFAIWVLPDDGLTNFINYEHFQILGGADIEQWIFQNTSLRLGLEVAAGLKEQRGQVYLGYSWGW